jgi:hypothetical protein
MAAAAFPASVTAAIVEPVPVMNSRREKRLEPLSDTVVFMT